MKNNVTLIGMPSAGKSTVGVLLAKRLGYSFIDVDLLIQEQEGKRLREIIEEQGLDGFLDVENRVNAGVEAEQAVIAPGGSVIYGKEAMEHLKSIGLVVYLKITYDELVKRVGDVKDRGVALKDGMTLLDLYHERISYLRNTRTSRSTRKVKSWGRWLMSCAKYWKSAVMCWEVRRRKSNNFT